MPALRPQTLPGDGRSPRQTVAPDRPNVCRAASDGENTPIAAPTRRHLSPTSAQTTKQGWVHEKRSSTEKPFLLGQRPRSYDWRRRFRSGRRRRVRVKPRRCRQVSGASAPPGPVAPRKQGTNEPSRSHDDRESDPTRPQLRIRPDFWLPA